MPLPYDLVPTGDMHYYVIELHDPSTGGALEFNWYIKQMPAHKAYQVLARTRYLAPGKAGESACVAACKPSTRAYDDASRRRQHFYARVRGTTYGTYSSTRGNTVAASTLRAQQWTHRDSELPRCGIGMPDQRGSCGCIYQVQGIPPRVTARTDLFKRLLTKELCCPSYSYKACGVSKAAHLRGSPFLPRSGLNLSLAHYAAGA